MPTLRPIKRKDLVRFLQKLGFSGPFSGAKHQFLQKEDITVRLPNPHKSDVGIELLKRILRQAHIEREDWERL